MPLKVILNLNRNLKFYKVCVSDRLGSADYGFEHCISLTQLPAVKGILENNPGHRDS